MSNHTYVCFDCRTTERVPHQRISRNCRKCRKAAHYVYYKFAIPKRDDSLGWNELESKVRPMNKKTLSQVMIRLANEREQLERVLSETPLTREAHRRDLIRRIRLNEKERVEWSKWSVA